jgi:VanZ family protein
MAAIFFMSNQPSEALPVYGPWDWLIKKGAHFLAYALLAFLAFRVTREGPRPYLIAFLIAFAYAVSDEIHQLFVDGRHGTAVDVVIDSLGALAALWLIHRKQITTNWERNR